MQYYYFVANTDFHVDAFDKILICKILCNYKSIDVDIEIKYLVYICQSWMLDLLIINTQEIRE